jgi:transcriptional regulator with XRE-family HTH domain
MSSVLHSRLHTQAVPVGSASPVSHERSLPMLSSSQDKTLAAGQERSRQQLHRLAAVRQQEGLSQHTIARRLGIGLREVQAQEQGSADLTLSMLYRWKESLNVPISELLKEDVGEPSSPVMFRGKLLRVMKTAVTILERTRNAATHRRAQFMVEQLIEIMPELKDTTPWPSVGKRRSRRELGRAGRLRLPANLMRDLDVS